MPGFSTVSHISCTLYNSHTAHSWLELPPSSVKERGNWLNKRLVTWASKLGEKEAVVLCILSNIMWTQCNRQWKNCNSFHLYKKSYHSEPTGGYRKLKITKSRKTRSKHKCKVLGCRRISWCLLFLAFHHILVSSGFIFIGSNILRKCATTSGDALSFWQVSVMLAANLGVFVGAVSWWCPAVTNDQCVLYPWQGTGRLCLYSLHICVVGGHLNSMLSLEWGFLGLS